TITGTNDAPVVSSALTSAANEGDGAFTKNLLDGASDPDDGETERLQVGNVQYAIGNGAASSTAPAGFSVSESTLTINAADPSFNHLAKGVTETVTVSYDITDPQGKTVSQTETVTITGTN